MRGRKSEHKLELLKQVGLFRHCTDKELGDIAALADEVSMPVGAVLTKEGTPGQECFVILSGQAEVRLRGDLLAELGPGDAVGEMALLDVSPRSATVTALTDMELLSIERSDFSALLTRHPSVAKQLLAALAQRLRDMENAPTY